MDNFSIFNQDQIAAAIEPFLPSVTGQLTPIAYQAWTPDIFFFLFRTTDPKGVEHFFASVTYDYLSDSKKEAAALLKDWKNLKVLEFLEPHVPAGEQQNEDGSIKISNIYNAYLARVAITTDLGYWANKITITKESDIDAELADFTEAQRHSVKEFVKKKEDCIVSVYKNDTGEMELFYWKDSSE